MSKVFVSMTVSLDGFVAPEWRSDAQWMEQWSGLQDWVFHQKFFRENLGIGVGGEEGVDDRVLREVFGRTGVTILGKRMFDAGERMWPENAPFHTPVFVLTHQERPDWQRPGGTVFHFVNDGIESALRRAREVAGDRDIRIGGGATVVQEYLRAGLVDEMHLAISPVLLGTGIRLLDRVDLPGLAILDGQQAPRVTHVRYRIGTR
jgi:dihydrofolate reductase